MEKKGDSLVVIKLDDVDIMKLPQGTTKRELHRLSKVHW